ncbi:MAG: hypothetical protein K2L07_04550 [Lachnospiraceae bacterium]|nr:hypothetical protein [Lachnospiraceae bacterium]
MKIRFHEKLYSDDISDRKLRSIKKKVAMRSTKLKLYLVTLPLGKQGILEVYWYPELLQKVYRNMKSELVVVGVANDRDAAFELVRQIISEISIQEAYVPVKEFFEEYR